MAVCPVDCFYRTDDGVVLHDKDLCIGCGYCFYACPFGAPQFPQAGAFGLRGKMDKCTFCAGGPEKDQSAAEFQKYGRNRLAEGKLPACAEMCSTKALLGGDGDVIADIYRDRVLRRGKGAEVWGWGTAYGPGKPAPRHPRKEQPDDASASDVHRAWQDSPACGDREEIAEGPRSYQGKPDSAPWDNEPLAAEYHGGKWTKGDRASWEADIKARQLTQHEYKRIEQ